MQELAQETIKKHWYSGLPKWLKAILLIISIVTVVYWFGFIVYQILKAIRCVGAYIFDKNHYWTFIICIFLIAISALLLAQFYFNLDPFGKFIDWLTNLFDSFIGKFLNEIA